MRIIFVLSFKLLEEADLDENAFLSYAEFENVIARSPEFMKWVELTDQPMQATVTWFSLHWPPTLPILELEFHEILLSVASFCFISGKILSRDLILLRSGLVLITPTYPIGRNRTKEPIEPNRTQIARLGSAIEQNRTPVLLWVRFSNQSNQYNRTKSNKIELIQCNCLLTPQTE